MCEFNKKAKARLIGFACIIDRSNKSSLKILSASDLNDAAKKIVEAIT